MSRRYEVWVRSGENDVKVYESDIECDVRVLLEGAAVYQLTGEPTFATVPDTSTAKVLEGGTVEATYVDDKGKTHKVVDKTWKTSP